MAYKATFRTRTYRTRNGRLRRTPPVPSMSMERDLRAEGAQLIAGVDEVGVGAWAGPVAVGAVLLHPDRRIYKVRDSKLLDSGRREWLAERVKERSMAWAVGMAWPDEIDREGLSEGIRRAAARAVAALPVEPDAFLLDGKWNFLGERTVTRVRGDCESVSIACASIVAKVTRDRLMAGVGSLYPVYEFDSNKGYPSPSHKWALRAVGPSPVHRRLFAPVRALIDLGVPGRLLPTSSREI